MRRPAESPNDQLCGVCSWRPRWLQKLADRRLFALSTSVITAVHSMISAYFYSVMTTLEKTFGLTSRTMGFILSGNDIVQILFGVLICYIAGRGSRPAWLAAGMLTTAASCFMFASAQLLWDGSVSHSQSAHSTVPSSLPVHHLCQVPEEGSWSNRSVDTQSCNGHPSNVPVLALLFAGQLISGGGSATIYILGMTYMDDSVAKRDSPLYISIMSGFRAFGPMVGFVIASLFLKVYIEPQSKPAFDKQDPRWLGAWWLGFLGIGATQLIITFPVLLFPKQLPKSFSPKSPRNNGTDMELVQEIQKETSSAKDFIATMKRILKSPFIVLSYLSASIVWLGLYGHTVFLPKYLEATFDLTSSQSSLATGITGTMMMMGGTFVGGLLIWKLQPSAFFICIATGVVQISFIIGLFILMSFKCDNRSFVGVDLNHGRITMTSNCSEQCDCTVRYDPVCLDSQNYLSPCSAGCTEVDNSVGAKTNFRNCMCTSGTLDGHLNSTAAMSMTAKMGYCPGPRSNCVSFWTYISIYGTMQFLYFAASSGVLVVFLRGTDKRDKSVATALGGNFLSLLAMLPAPILYGAVADSTCRIWETTYCGQKRNCWIYDVENFRLQYHGVTIACFTIGTVFQFAVAIFARQINMYSDDPPTKTVYVSWREGLGLRRKYQKETHVTGGQDVMKALI